MSGLGEARAAIVDALGRLDELAVTPDPPEQIVAGCAWPSWQNATPVSFCAWEHSWHVFVALPAGTLSTSIDAADELMVTAADALTEVGAVELVDYAAVTTGEGAAVPCLRYTLTTTA